MNLKVEVNVSSEEYFRLNLKLSYRNKIILFLTIIGCLQFILVVFYVLGFTNIFPQFPWIQLFFGLIMTVGMPYFIYQNSKKNFETNSFLNEKLTYEFGDDSYKIMSNSLNAELKWENVINIVELKDWILLYQNSQVAHLIPKSSLGNRLNEFLLFLKSKRIKNNLKPL